MRMSSPSGVPQATTPQAGQVLNVAHRGASAHAPENTLSAVRLGIARDADLVELDVQRSKDGALVLVHDTTLTRTTNVQQLFPDRAPWLVGDFTHEEILRLDAGSWKSPNFAGEKVPTLAEAIEVLWPSRAGLLLELKAATLYPGIVPEVAYAMQDIRGYVESATAARRLVVQSFCHTAMNDYKALEPSVPVGLLGTPTRAQLPELATWADQINPSHHTVDAAYVAAVHRTGMACMVWTVDRVPAMRRALDMGVDGVITNRPDVLHGVLLDRIRDCGASRANPSPVAL